jgi:helicase
MVKETTNDGALNVSLKTINEGKQALVFVNSKRSAEKMAEDIASKLKPVEEVQDLAEKAEKTLSKPTKQCLRLAKCLKKGIAFHHAGLHQKQKDLIEDNFRAGKIKIIACTPTLAAGLDMPAFRVIVRDLKRYGGHWGMTPIPVLEYLQMAGRAGRPGKETYGEAISISTSKTEQEDIHQTYVRGKPESIYSKLAVEPVLRTYVLSLVASKILGTEEELQRFFEKTFWAKQYEDNEKLHSIISKVIHLLDEYGFLITQNKTDLNQSNQSDFVSANDLINNKAGKLRATAIGKRVAELYLDPLTAHHLIECLKNANAKLEKNEVNEFSFLQMISNTIEMLPLLRVKTREFDEINDKLALNEEFLLQEEPSLYDVDHDDFLNSVKTALFFIDWINEKDEEFLLEKFDIRPGETRYKLDKAEWLFYACTEFCDIMEFKDLNKELRKIETRVKHGVKEELLPLLRLSMIGRVRARALFNNQIKTIKDIKKADITTLSTLIGKKIAENIKKQVNQDQPEEVSKRKRKGQMSIEKYDN